VESREVWSAWARRAVHLWAFTDDGGRIELLVERSGAAGFHIAVEATIEPSGDRVKHPRQALFEPCAPSVEGHPWLDAFGGS
jgi:hypothetical protein